MLMNYATIVFPCNYGWHLLVISAGLEFPGRDAAGDVWLAVQSLQHHEETVQTGIGLSTRHFAN